MPGNRYVIKAFTAKDGPHLARAHFVTAALAWAAVLLSLSLTVLNAYPISDYGPGIYGSSDSLAVRLTDALSYFTMWSNIMVAVSGTVLALDPQRDAAWRRALLLSALLMIIVTAIIYAVVLAPDITLQGWSQITSPLLHIVVPAVFVLVWICCGPRGWVTRQALRGALLIPAIWIVWVLARGAVTGTYPYGFVNVGQVGYLAVVLALALTLGFGLLIFAALAWVDRCLARLA